jgi:hypothetical protein
MSPVNRLGSVLRSLCERPARGRTPTVRRARVVQKRRGVVMIISLMMLLVMTLLAVGLLAMTQDEVSLAGNKRNARMARFAAEAGIAHYIGMGYSSDRARAASGGVNGFEIIPLTPVDGIRETANGHYTVKVSFCCEADGADLPASKVRVTSTGSLRTGDFVRAQAQVSVVVDHFDPHAHQIDREAQGALSRRSRATQKPPGSASLELPSPPRRN